MASFVLAVNEFIRLLDPILVKINNVDERGEQLNEVRKYAKLLELYFGPDESANVNKFSFDFKLAEPIDITQITHEYENNVE